MIFDARVGDVYRIRSWLTDVLVVGLDPAFATESGHSRPIILRLVDSQYVESPCHPWWLIKGEASYVSNAYNPKLRAPRTVVYGTRA
jgi:hypothetical protein